MNKNKIRSFDSIQCVRRCVIDKDLLLENLNTIVICHMTHSWVGHHPPVWSSISRKITESQSHLAVDDEIWNLLQLSLLVKKRILETTTFIVEESYRFLVKKKRVEKKKKKLSLFFQVECHYFLLTIVGPIK